MVGEQEFGGCGERGELRVGRVGGLAAGVGVGGAGVAGAAPWVERFGAQGGSWRGG